MTYYSCFLLTAQLWGPFKQMPSIQKELNSCRWKFWCLIFFPPCKFFPPNSSILHSHPTNNYIDHWKKHLREIHLQTFMNYQIHNIKINICTAWGRFSNLVSLTRSLGETLTSQVTQHCFSPRNTVLISGETAQNVLWSRMVKKWGSRQRWLPYSVPETAGFKFCSHQDVSRPRDHITNLWGTGP